MIILISGSSSRRRSRSAVIIVRHSGWRRMRRLVENAQYCVLCYGVARGARPERSDFLGMCAYLKSTLPALIMKYRNRGMLTDDFGEGKRRGVRYWRSCIMRLAHKMASWRDGMPAQHGALAARHAIYIVL